MDQPQNSPALPPNSSLNERLIVEQIVKLLSHYWLPSENETMRRAQLGDWLDDLKEFAAPIVNNSCTMWRRTETRRPTPADIRRLCGEMRISRPVNQTSHTPGRPPDHVIRDDWRTRHVHEWTKFELQTANDEMLTLARKYGFNTGADRHDRNSYAKAALDGLVPGYDCTTGLEVNFTKKSNFAIPA